MNEFFTRFLLEQEEITPFSSFPKNILEEYEKGIVEYIENYYLEYNQLPTPNDLAEEFDFFVPFSFVPSIYNPTPKPLARLEDDTKKKKTGQAILTKIREMENLIEEGHEIPAKMFAEIEDLNNPVGNKLVDFSTYDRAMYVRRNPVNIKFNKINQAIGGLNEGDYMLVAGRLGVGKTTIAQFITADVVTQTAGYTVLFVSAEMVTADIFGRIDGMLNGFNPLIFRTGGGDVAGCIELATQTAKGISGKLYTSKTTVRTPRDIKVLADRIKADLIVVDGAYLLAANEKSSGGGADWRNVTSVSNQLKAIARNETRPTRVIAVVQIKRGADGAEGYSAEDLSFADSLGQDADFILTLWPSPIMEGQIELQLIKNRFGDRIVEYVRIDFDKMTITPLNHLSRETETW